MTELYLDMKNNKCYLLGLVSHIHFRIILIKFHLKTGLLPWPVSFSLLEQSHKSEDQGFDSWSEHMPRLGVQSPVRVRVRGN